MLAETTNEQKLNNTILHSISVPGELAENRFGREFYWAM